MDVITSIGKQLRRYRAPTPLRKDNSLEFIAHAQSFGSRFRDKFLNIKLFASQAEDKVLAKQLRIKSSVNKPHSECQAITPLDVPRQ